MLNKISQSNSYTESDKDYKLYKAVPLGIKKSRLASGILVLINFA